MNVKPTSFFVVLAALVVAAAFGAAPASAQPQLPPCGTPHCGPFDDYPTNPCNGPNDPFCAGGGGGTAGPCEKCARKVSFGVAFYQCCSTAQACQSLRDDGYFVFSQGYVWCTALVDRCSHGDSC